MSEAPPLLSRRKHDRHLPDRARLRGDEIHDGIALAEVGVERSARRAGSDLGLPTEGTVDERLADLQAAMDDPEIGAIWCARGGYGTVHLLERLDLRGFRMHPKWVVGFSDVTALHELLQSESIASLHAQMPFAIANKTKACKGSLRDALFGSPQAITWGRPASGPWCAGFAESTVVGGNLSVLHSLRGTPYDLDITGKILFLEDLDELRYHVDRMVQNIRLGGWFRQAAGLLIGGMTDMRDKDPADPFGRDALAIIADALDGPAIPVACGMPVGHIADNRALVLGRTAKLNITTNDAMLRFVHDRP
ncbi:MAG: LD-carboxypeptidase [Flavobacteriales bacterium]|nr:LD-carboxypeptidase [Flavobacteriales bacterium]